MTTTLVGRERPRELLRGEIRRASESHGGLVLVTGEPGIGKTALVTEAIRDARSDDAVVLTASCWQRDSVPGYWPWIQVIRDLQRAASSEEWACALDMAGDDVSYLLGELSRAPEASEADETLFRLGDAAATVLSTVSRMRPVIIAIDDLHWADTASVRMLDFIVGHSWFERILVIGTHRDVDVEHAAGPAPRLLRDLAPKATIVTLSGLDADAVGVLMTRRGWPAPGPDAIAEVHSRTGGNPLFAQQLIELRQSGAALESAPSGVRATVQRRLEQLPGPVVDVLTAAAFLGPAFQPRTLAEGASRPEAEVAQVLHQLVAVGLIRSEGAARYAFIHGLVRETVYAAVDDDERRRRHARMLAVTEHSRDDRAASLPDLAHHAYNAVPHVPAGHATRVLLAAARAASCRLAWEETAGHYARAVELMPAEQPRRRAVVELALGAAQLRAGQLEEATRTMNNVLNAARRLDEPVLLARAVLGVHHVGRGAGGHAEIDLLEEADAALGHAGTTGAHAAAHAALAARVLAATARARVHQSPGADVGELAARAVRLARASADDDALAFCLLAAHDAGWGPGTASDRLPIIAEMTAVADRTGDAEQAFQASLLRIVALLELGDPGASDEFAAMVRIAERSALPRLRFVALSRQGMMATLQGRFDEAQSFIDQAFALGERLGEGDRYALWRDQRWLIAVSRGDLYDVDELLDSLPGDEDEFVRVMRSITAVRRGDVSDAGHRVRWINAISADVPPWFMPLWLMLRAEIAAVSDATVRAQVREELLPLRDTWLVVYGAGVVLGPVTYYLAMLDAADEKWEDAVAGFEAARDAAERMYAWHWSHAARDRLTAMAAAGSAGGGDVAHIPTEPAEAAFRLDGSVWQLVYAGRTAHLPDSKGLRDLHVLLGHPGTDIKAADLLEPAAGDEVRQARSVGADAVLDETAKKQYRARLAQLDAEIEHAVDVHDDARAAELDRERQALIDQLRTAAGLGGRDRRLGDEAERSRKTVSARIRDAIRRVDEQHPELAEHLRSAVSTGIHCRYQPPAEVAWLL